MTTQKFFGNLFLSAGAMKAGTTWLFHVLNRHPEIYFTPEKELHYFFHRFVNPALLSPERRMTEAKTRYLKNFDPKKSDIDVVRKQVAWVGSYLSHPVDDAWYRNLFAGRRRETYCCDFSNLYAQMPTEAWQYITHNTQRLRVLYTLRDPVDRLWSHVKFQLQVMGQTANLSTWGPDDFADLARKPHMWINAEYGAALRRMKAGVPEECLKVIFFEDIHADPEAMLADLEDFLGIARFSYPPALVQRKINPSLEHPMPDFFPELFAEDIARIIAELEAEGLSVPATWRSSIPAEN